MVNGVSGYNLIALYSPDAGAVLMCVRRREPYKGLYNFVGGHIERGESGEDAAYRELFEETGVERGEVSLSHIMDFTYYLEKCYVEVWCGRLTREKEVYGDENDLVWVKLDKNEDFFGPKYAGNGNIGHILEIIELEAKL